MQREEDTVKEIPRQIVGSAFDAVNELLSIDRLSIAVYNETTHKLEYTSNPVEDTAVDDLPVRRKYKENCFEQKVYISEKSIQALPLIMDAGNMCRSLGMMCLKRREGTNEETEQCGL